MEKSSRHLAALAYAAAGIPVFPVEVGGKRPLPGSHGFKDATSRIDVIDAWWAEDDYNLAIEPERAGWCVVDIDGITGAANWQKTPIGPSTYIVDTPSDGMHLYYKGSLPPSAGKLAPCVDTRGRNSYVLVPPSVVGGREYTASHGTWGPPENWELAELPAWIAERFTTSETGPVAAPAGTLLDLPVNIERAIAYLRHLPGAVEGEGGDEQTYQTIAAIMELGLSEAGCAEAMQEWNARCRPPWDEDDLAVKIGNAARYMQNEPGAYAASGTLGNQFGERVAADPPAPAVYPLIKSLAELEHMNFPEPSWLWHERLLQNEPNLYTGDAGVGKTTLAENIAVAVASGVELLGASSTQATVLLLVAEDEYGPVRSNLLKISTEHEVDVRQGVHVLSVKADRIPGGHRLATIDDDGAVHDTPFMREVVAPWVAEHAANGPVLLVIDPLAEFISFDRYKDAPPRALATDFLDAVCRIGAKGGSRGNVTVLVTDHPSKASMADGHHYAGSVQLKASFPLFATLKRDGKAEHGTAALTFSVEKGRYAGEEETKLLRRGNSPAFILASALATDAGVLTLVYDAIEERESRNVSTGRDNNSPSYKAFVAGLDGLTEPTVRSALRELERTGKISWHKAMGDNKHSKEYRAATYRTVEKPDADEF